ncbi:nucleotidyl transferase AbiEii/AbiGii toxin family protein [Streptomyces sp. NPDC005012]|uniref:nucleotidyl transferase AbiEii/AbiGii toxin family protein n=1 Tax=Streptomyces sp. NPDC005012 TaxID=3154558 RepID=UPI0033A6AB2D
MSTRDRPWRPREFHDLPRTLRWVAADGVSQDPVFDPSMKQHADAYRASDPRFADPARGAAWRDARRRAMGLVLRAIADSPWADSLVLRGSALMALWFGPEAREPGDLDFVVVPRDWRLEDGRTARMFGRIAEDAQSLAERTERTERTGEAGETGKALRISASGAVSDDIWTYDRVPGRRLVLPWSAPDLPDLPDLPAGSLQLDFVFGEELLEEPGLVELPDGAVLRAATPELSLAWKVTWLVSDSYPQGKDLYDAVLLAERHTLTRELLAAALRQSEEWPHFTASGRLAREDLAALLGHVLWDDFTTDHPELAGRREEFTERLLDALTPALGLELA